MPRLHVHPESHVISRIGRLRAAGLGANDGIVSTASLIVGAAGAADLVAGAMSMAVGEYVSVSSQSDTELADLARERAELASQPEFERADLTGSTSSAACRPPRRVPCPSGRRDLRNRGVTVHPPRPDTRPNAGEPDGRHPA